VSINAASIDPASIDPAPSAATPFFAAYDSMLERWRAGEDAGRVDLVRADPGERVRAGPKPATSPGSPAARRSTRGGSPKHCKNYKPGARAIVARAPRLSAEIRRD
jgi:hypothetical protein